MRKFRVESVPISGLTQDTSAGSAEAVAASAATAAGTGGNQQTLSNTPARADFMRLYFIVIV
jgi:hypothetical protein